MKVRTGKHKWYIHLDLMINRFLMTYDNERIKCMTN